MRLSVLLENNYRLVSRHELASRFGITVNRNTLRRWQMAGAFPKQMPTPNGGRAFWLEREIVAWVEQAAARRKPDPQTETTLSYL